MELEFLPCPTCRDITLVEVPPCPDAHGTDCPDRACTVCGTALTSDCAPSTGLLATTASAKHIRSVA